MDQVAYVKRYPSHLCYNCKARGQESDHGEIGLNQADHVTEPKDSLAGLEGSNTYGIHREGIYRNPQATGLYLDPRHDEQHGTEIEQEFAKPLQECRTLSDMKQDHIEFEKECQTMIDKVAVEEAQLKKMRFAKEPVIIRHSDFWHLYNIELMSNPEVRRGEYCLAIQERRRLNIGKFSGLIQQLDTHFYAPMVPFPYTI